MEKYTEDSSVKYPTIIHLMGMGYEYVSSNTSSAATPEPYDELTDILTERFTQSFLRLNPTATEEDAAKKLEEIQNVLDYDDLGRRFYKEYLCETGFGRIIDLSSPENFERNNTFQVATEMRCGQQSGDNFRPDITLFVNGLPLAYIEVKKHNNQEGLNKETERTSVRLKNRKYRRFHNITQIMVFSNDMEYDNENVRPTQGAFYATIGKTTTKYNCFREDGQTSFPVKMNFNQPSWPEIEVVLADMNKHSYKSADWFHTLLNAMTPTKRIVNSLFSFERFHFLLKYGIAYVEEPTGLQKHIMRYPQIFATKAIEKHLEAGNDRGVIWHTQGSGKTALSYFNVHYLTDYYSKKGIVPQFFFIVDRLDLLIQAQDEFSKRGLRVKTVDSKEEFKSLITSNTTTYNTGGEAEIVVVNIQKFSDNEHVVSKKDYNLNTKRIYFIDEAHRDYKPEGCFLKNLMASDRNAIRIALTGTPIVSNEFNTRDIFGDYIHTYYYSASIADGYTLRLKREAIESNFKIKMQEILEQIKIEAHSVRKEDIYNHRNFVSPLLDYVIADLKKFRAIDSEHKNVGGMMICSSADQARLMYHLFLERYADPQEIHYERNEDGESYPVAISASDLDAKDAPPATGKMRAALILYDMYDKEERKKWVKLYKEGKVDLLIVYQMLQTGFDAPRLKKLYLNRFAKEHNLLQTLTRVNRPYKGLKFGNVVDFANIEEEYKKTNERYQKELETETGGNTTGYESLFISPEEAIKRMKECAKVLEQFPIGDTYEFSRQIDTIDNKDVLRKLLHALEDVRDLENMLVSQGSDKDIITVRDVSNLLKLVHHRIDFINFDEGSDNRENISAMLNQALENISFSFFKTGEEELVLQQQFREAVQHTRMQLQLSFDPLDPEYTSLLDEFYRVLKKNGSQPNESQLNMSDRVASLNKILAKIKYLNEQDAILALQYRNDKKYARVHKRLTERAASDEMREAYSWSANKQLLNSVLLQIKQQADDCYLHNTDLLSNPDYFSHLLVSFVARSFGDNNISSNRSVRQYVGDVINTEYQHELRYY